MEGRPVRVLALHAEHLRSGQRPAKVLEIPATDVHSQMQAMGGGFGSKFGHDRWGEFGARLSKNSGGRAREALPGPLHGVADRRQPAVAVRKDQAGRQEGRNFTVWQSESWATGGIGGGGLPAGELPYVFRGVPNKRMTHTSVSVNAAEERAWRAPNNPQLSYVTCTAMEDLAAKLNMDPVEFFDKNLGYAGRVPGPEVYRAQLKQAAEAGGVEKAMASARPVGTGQREARDGDRLQSMAVWAIPANA